MFLKERTVKLKNKKSLIVFFVVVLLTVAGLWLIEYVRGDVVKEEVPVSVPTVVTEKAVTEKFVLHYDALGKVASTTYRIGAESVRGRVSSIFVKKGDYVKEGAAVLSLDVTSAIAQLKLQITGIVQGIKELDLSISQLRTKREDMLKMFEKGLVAKNAVDEIYNNIKSLELKRQGLVNNKAAINAQINEISSTGYVYAKKSGVVKKVGIKLHQIPAMEDYIEIEIDQKPVVKLYLTEEVVKDVSEGEVVDVYLDDVLYKGKIKEIHSLSTGDILYPVDVEVDTTEKFLAGMSADVKIPIYHNDAALLINRKAVISFNDEVFVYKVVDDKVVKTLIEIGDTVNSMTEVKSGLTAGDGVVVEGQFSVVDGEKVEVLVK